MEVSAQVQPHVFQFPFADVLSALSSHKQVDSTSAGYSPVTVRWLTKKNKFVNLGLVELDKKTCQLVRNNNSFGVTDEELNEAYDGIAGHVANVSRK